MDLFILLLSLLILWHARPAGSAHGFHEDYISLTTSKAMRGIFALVVIFHHLTQHVTGGHVFRFFENAGFLAVGIFFFFSGYGLQRKYMTDASYKKGFLLKRIPSVLIPYLVATFVYWIAYNLTGTGSSFTYMLSSIISRHALVSNSWYVMTILAFYVFFAILMMLFAEHFVWIAAGGAAFTFLWSIFCIKTGFGIWWYNATLCIGFGMFWAVGEKQLLNKIKKHSTVFLLFSALCFLISFHYLKPVGAVLPDLYVPFERVIGIFFILTVLGISMKFRIGNRVLYFIGTVSYELYLIHGLWIYLLEYFTGTEKNELLFAAAVLLCSVISAVPLHKLSVFLNSAFKKHVVSR